MMDEHKKLHKTSQSNSYVGENNADKILVLLPLYYGEIDLKSCLITLNMINQDKLSDIVSLSFSDVLYKERYIQATVPITSEFTYISGNIELWLQVVNNEELILKTDSAFITINEHKEISDFIPEQTLSLFDTYMIEIEQMRNTAQITLDGATEQFEKCMETANLIIRLMQEWEDKYGNDNQ